MSRVRVTFQGLLVWFAHPVILNVGAARDALAYDESKCARLTFISGSISKRHLINDYDAISLGIDSPDLTI